MDLLAGGPSCFAAIKTMDPLLPVLAVGGKAWVSKYADDTGLWIEHGIGRRVCAWIDRVVQSSPGTLSADTPEWWDIDFVLAALVSPAFLRQGAPLLGHVPYFSNR
ncbi:hypothetical protein [Mesorhizobium sp. IMUNJ 23232]|uniref:hypothetical protein n=1 Tax=Mesorhizobium sp. IMUNJ 23232 TaxID=3376064 RepID=UPI0037B0492F